MAEAQRERGVVDAWCDRGDLRAAAHAVGPLPAETLLDDVLAPMRAVLNGYRIVFEERALAFDQASTTARAESRRKTRTLAGNYQILGQERRLLVPIANPGLAAIRLPQGRPPARPVGPAARICLEHFLATTRWYYTAALTVQMGFYGLALVGGLAEMRGSRRSREFERYVNAAGKGSTVNG